MRPPTPIFSVYIAKINGDWDRAADHLAKSVAAEPDYTESHAELGLAKMHLGDLAGARAEQQQQRLHDLDAKRSEKTGVDGAHYSRGT